MLSGIIVSIHYIENSCPGIFPRYLASPYSAVHLNLKINRFFVKTLKSIIWYFSLVVWVLDPNACLSSNLTHGQCVNQDHCCFHLYILFHLSPTNSYLIFNTSSQSLLFDHPQHLTPTSSPIPAITQLFTQWFLGFVLSPSPWLKQQLNDTHSYVTHVFCRHGNPLLEAQALLTESGCLWYKKSLSLYIIHSSFSAQNRWPHEYSMLFYYITHVLNYWILVVLSVLALDKTFLHQCSSFGIQNIGNAGLYPVLTLWL